MIRKWIKCLKKTKCNLQEKLTSLAIGYKDLGADFYNDLEETLITSDIGVVTSIDLIKKLRAIAKAKRLKTPEEVLGQLKEEIIAIFKKNNGALKYNSFFNF